MHAEVSGDLRQGVLTRQVGARHRLVARVSFSKFVQGPGCLLYTSDAADE